MGLVSSGSIANTSENSISVRNDNSNSTLVESEINGESIDNGVQGTFSDDDRYYNDQIPFSEE